MKPGIGAALAPLGTRAGTLLERLRTDATDIHRVKELGTGLVSFRQCPANRDLAVRLVAFAIPSGLRCARLGREIAQCPAALGSAATTSGACSHRAVWPPCLRLSKAYGPRTPRGSNWTR